MSDGITTAASMKDWKADVPCCTTRPYDHVHPGAPVVAQTFVEIAAEIEEVIEEMVEEFGENIIEDFVDAVIEADLDEKIATTSCPLCAADGDEPCVTAKGRVKETPHKVRPVTETEEEDESETE